MKSEMQILRSYLVGAEVLQGFAFNDNYAKNHVERRED